MDIIWVRFSDPNWFFFQSTIYGLWPTMDIIWVRFSDPNWFFFQSIIYGLWPDDGYFLNPIFGPNFFLSVHHLWVVADDGYFLGSIFGPKLIFLSVHHLWIVARRWIFFESDFRTQTDFSFSPPFMDCGPTMDIFLIRFLDPNLFFLLPGISRHQRFEIFWFHGSMVPWFNQQVLSCCACFSLQSNPPFCFVLMWV